jgi:hypothetical protein
MRQFVSGGDPGVKGACGPLLKNRSRFGGNNSAIASSCGHATGAECAPHQRRWDHAMLFRAILCCAALILALLFGLKAGATPADAGGKPLDLMQFMREQAASTRKAEAARHATAKRRRAAERAHRKPRAVAAKPKEKEQAVAAKPQPPAVLPMPMPREAAASFAAQPPPEVEVVASDEINSIDLAGEAASPETVGAPPAAAEPPVEVAAAGALDALDRDSSAAAPAASSPPVVEAEASWMQWLWSAVSGAFAALAAAVRQLIG